MQVEHNLQEECVVLQASLQCMPSARPHPLAPWSSLVINFNVATLAHRDPKDEHICCVLVIGDCKGGDLCLYEPGLVIPLQSGDFVAFKSGDITHFNLHFQGERVSFVFHTDREMKSWKEDRNGWIVNVHFRYVISAQMVSSS